MTTKMSAIPLNMCRACMSDFSSKKKRKKDKTQNICEVPTGCKNNVTILEILQILQPERKMEPEDNLPTLVCTDCIDKLIMIHEFIEMYKKTDEKLRDILKNDTKIAVDDLNDSLDNEVITIKKENKTNEMVKCEFQIEELIIGDNVTKEEEYETQELDYENEPLEEVSNEKEHLLLDTLGDKCVNEILYENSQSTNISHNDNNDDIIKNCITKEMTTKNGSTDEIETNEELCNEIGMKCQECEEVLDNIVLYQEHLKTHTLDKSIKRKYSKKRDISKKKKTDRKTLHKCEHCEKEFTQLAPYKSHLRMHSVETPFLCVECGKGFKSISGLNTHMLRHKGEKTFQCPHCPKKFVCSSGLCSHMIIHSNKKPYVCNICGSAFHQAYELRHHNLYHEGVKKYKCEYCDKSFVTKDKQTRHMRTHTGEKPYRCKYCDRAFAQTSDCVKHLRQHLGDNVYQCELCPQRFPLLRDLRAHFNNHKDDDEETRKRNLEARIEEERNLNIKLGFKES